jgi:hypothetical protein
MIDRDLQKRIEWDPSKPQTGTFSGIPGGVDIQDCAVQESMGSILDRTIEHLGTTDSMIILTRKVMLRAVKAMRDHGTIPPGVDQPELFRLRSGGAILPVGVDGLEVLKPVHSWQSDTVEMELPTPVVGS